MEEEKEKLETGIIWLSLQSKTISDIDLELVSLKSRKNEETELEEGFVMFLRGLEDKKKQDLGSKGRIFRYIIFHCLIYLFLVFNLNSYA